MKRMLNTLYVTTPDAYLARDGDNVLVRVDGKEKFRAPVHLFDGVVTFGYIGTSPAFLEMCVHNGTSVSFLSQHGRFLARVEGRRGGNVLLRREQYRWADAAEQSAGLAGQFIAAKILNCRTALQRGRRDYPEIADVAFMSAIESLKSRAVAATQADSLDEIRGIEGDAARTYFGLFGRLIRDQREAFAFLGRSRRPPLDPVNCLLSFCYTLLMHEVSSALECVGLDPSVGYLHRDRPGRQSLSLDLMEELRAYMADRFVLALINRAQMRGADFAYEKTGEVRMTDSARKGLIGLWQERKQTEIMHPFLKERISLGLLPYAQAQLLARHIRGDLDGYPAFLWR